MNYKRAYQVHYAFFWSLLVRAAELQRMRSQMPAAQFRVAEAGLPQAAVLLASQYQGNLECNCSQRSSLTKIRQLVASSRGRVMCWGKHANNETERRSPSPADFGLQQDLAELEAAYDAAPVGMFVCDLECRFVRANARLAEMDGATIEEHLGKRPWELMPGLAHLEPVYRRVLDFGETIRRLEVAGTVDIRWSLHPVDQPTRLVLEWVERNGPPVSRPDRKGFGHKVTTEIIVRALDAEISQEFSKEGLYWSVAVPLKHVLQKGRRAE